jgi:hypothetical protein
MSGRRWDERWQRFPPSSPLPAADGIATSKRRGQMADAWWSRRFVHVLESYGLGGRLQRGRRYARAGQTLSLDVMPGMLVSQVQGSRPRPYVVTVRAAEPTEAQWRKLDDAFRSRVGFAARLLAGEVPPELEDTFARAGVELIPSTWAALVASCTCPDWENPCKHIAAALYVFADQLDRDPWLLLAWRGRTREEVLAHLHAAGGEPDPRLPPWWPLAPGAAPPAGVRVRAAAPDPPVPAERVLARLEPLGVEVGGVPVLERLAGAYRALHARDGGVRVDAAEPSAPGGPGEDAGPIH